MAKAEEKNTKSNFFTRFGTRCVAFFKRIGRFFINMWHELKKVTWPTRKEIINYSLVVLAFIVIMIIIIGVFDLGASRLVGLITGV